MLSLILMTAGAWAQSVPFVGDASRGFSVRTTRQGSGDPVHSGQNITFHYILKVGEERILIDSHKLSKPFTCTLGKGELIPGLEKGLLGMRLNETRLITVPPEEGYGEQGSYPIPPNATIIFDVELLEVR